MSKGLNFVERMALEVAKRFGDFGFEDVKSEDVRRYLETAKKIVATTAPKPHWLVERRLLRAREIDRLKKHSKVNPSRSTLSRIESLQRATNEDKALDDKMQEDFVDAAKKEPTLYGVFCIGEAAKQQKRAERVRKADELTSVGAETASTLSLSCDTHKKRKMMRGTYAFE